MLLWSFGALIMRQHVLVFFSAATGGGSRKTFAELQQKPKLTTDGKEIAKTSKGPVSLGECSFLLVPGVPVHSLHLLRALLTYPKDSGLLMLRTLQELKGSSLKVWGRRDA